MAAMMVSAPGATKAKAAYDPALNQYPKALYSKEGERAEAATEAEEKALRKDGWGDPPAFMHANKPPEQVAQTSDGVLGQVLAMLSQLSNRMDALEGKKAAAEKHPEPAKK